MFLSREEDLVLDADFRGDYVQSDWAYSSDDRNFVSFERLSTSSGVNISNLNQRYTIAHQTPAHRFGYYAPAIVATVQGATVVYLDFVVHVLSDDNGEWTLCDAKCYQSGRSHTFILAYVDLIVLYSI